MPQKKKHKTRWNDEAPVEEAVRKVLPRIAAKWFRAGEAAMNTGMSWEDMHDFRLLTKRFRYTLEIFRPCFGSSLEERIGLIRTLQTYLGEVNDCVTTEALLPSTLR